MKIIRDVRRFKEKSSVVALGTFDGVHLGHKRVISKAVEAAKKKRIPCVVVTFDPHPMSVIRKDKNVLLLTDLEERAYFISELGADYLVVIKFDKKLENTSYKRFAEKYLSGYLRAAHIFAGNDYTLGRNKEGNISKLRKLGLELGFAVTGVTDKIENGRIVKSTLIRSLLKEGNFGHAVSLLGHPYLIKGKVIRGYGRGRELGYPTANIEVCDDKVRPKSGVYCGDAVISGKRYRCVVNIGSRPTFNAKDITIEAHIIGFHKDITGQDISVLLMKRLRDEKRFKTVRELMRAITKDVGCAV